MKNFYLLCIGISLTLYSFSIVKGQDSSSSSWDFNIDANLNFDDPFIFLPVFQANKNKLHLEMRYNYEDLNTFSAWAGYNFTGGKKFEYDIVPMAGGVVGEINGLTAGLELTFDFAGFEFYSESEYVFDLSDKENNFYYNWSDLSFSPADWFFFGLTYQRTILFQTDSDNQGGFLLGGNYKNWGITAYLINVGIDEPFFQLTLSAEF